MRLIDADLLKAAVPEVEPDSYEDCENCDMMGDIAVRDLIDAAPTVDAVPVVRCRECVSYGADVLGIYHCSNTMGLLFPQDDSFCNSGQRKEQSEDNEELCRRANKAECPCEIGTYRWEDANEKP